MKRTNVTPVVIPADLIKVFSERLCFPLAHIFNLIIKSDDYASILENRYVTLIPKKNAPNDFSRVRPIAMTPVFCKVYESFLATWLKKQVIKLIDPKEFGNIPRTSIAHYLVSLLDKILKVLGEPEHWINLIAIDIKKSF